MMGRRLLEHVINHYAEFRQENGLLPVTLETVFGYAWRKEEVSSQMENGEILVPVSAITYNPSANKS